MIRITVWRETLAAGKFGEVTPKTYLEDESLTNFVHFQTKNYENYVIRCKQAVTVWLTHQNLHFAP